MISISLGRELGLKELSKKCGRGAGGEITLQRTTVNCLQIGKIMLKNIPIYITDLSALNSKLGLELGGIIGYDIPKFLR